MAVAGSRKEDTVLCKFVSACNKQSVLSGIVVKALKNYEDQKNADINPEFKAKDIGLDPSELSFWK